MAAAMPGGTSPKCFQPISTRPTTTDRWHSSARARAVPMGTVKPTTLPGVCGSVLTSTSSIGEGAESPSGRGARLLHGHPDEAGVQGAGQAGQAATGSGSDSGPAGGPGPGRRGSAAGSSRRRPAARRSPRARTRADAVRGFQQQEAGREQEERQHVPVADAEQARELHEQGRGQHHGKIEPGGGGGQLDVEKDRNGPFMRGFPARGVAKSFGVFYPRIITTGGGRPTESPTAASDFSRPAACPRPASVN